MPAAIRQSIIEALETELATMTTSNGYRTDITSVTVEAKDWAELFSSETSWIGIVPQDETFNDQPGYVRTVWNFDIIAHLVPSTNSTSAATVAYSDFVTDLRLLLYNTNKGQLGVSGVHMVMLVSVRSSLGSPEAVEELYTTAVARLAVTFEESQAAS